MNVSAINYNSVNLNNNSVHKINKNISLYGGKTAVAEKAKYNIGCLDCILLLAALSPFLLLSKIHFDSKNDKIDSMTMDIKREYENHHGNFKYFEDEIKDMNKLIDKHAKNEEYAQFVKEALSFLHTNFKQNNGSYDECSRLEPFKIDNNFFTYEWFKFIDTINKSAKAAVAKNNKAIDIEQLNKNIEIARNTMQQGKNIDK